MTNLRTQALCLKDTMPEPFKGPHPREVAAQFAVFSFEVDQLSRDHAAYRAQLDAAMRGAGL